MSTKHLRRFLLEKTADEGKTIKKEAISRECEQSSDDEDVSKAFICNSSKDSNFKSAVTICQFIKVATYEFLEELREGQDETSGKVKEARMDEGSENKAVKKRKKGKKKSSSTTAVNRMKILNNFPLQNTVSKLSSNKLFERDLFKINGRKLDVENELRSILGRKNTHVTQRRRVVFGKIVKRKETWPEIKNVGLSMELERTEGNILWFRFSHHANYREVQQNFWMASDSSDHQSLSDILAQYPYHLDTLIVMSEHFRQQEDYQLSRDLIERGLFCCETAFAPRFQLCNFDHRINYSDAENRAFYLLLHQHMRNLLDRRCFKTALEVAKLIYRLDPVSDPLAILLIIDMIAIKAKEYEYLIQLYNTLVVPRNLDKLPNFAYSVPLAHFLLFCETEDVKEKEIADTMISSAIVHFPTVVMKILDALNVQPDSDLENNSHMNMLGYHRESEGIKTLTVLYTKLSSSIWLENTSIIPWLETATRSFLSSFNRFTNEFKEWQHLRKIYYVGIPLNIQRHAYLWEVIGNQRWAITNPAPPRDGNMRYSRLRNEQRSDSFLSGLLTSIWSHQSGVSVGLINS
ncbi:unnamed protein product [Thelazia callipaeda]|uniref:Transcription factor 25 n=1 Tax=Thelazia callipaeda TaxID=103827 RepID=A0A0N5D7P5_THECL|nr:unnamed protein product [Thelazia callipaeda]